MKSTGLSLAFRVFLAAVYGLPAALASPQELLNACAAGDVAQIRKLVAGGESVSRPCNGFTPLLMACHKGYLEAANCLIEAGADVMQGSPSGLKPLAAAAGSGNVELVKLLVAHGADPAVSGCAHAPIVRAVMQGHLEVTRFLLECGVSANTMTRYGKDDDFSLEETLIQVASRTGNVEMAQLLLSCGADRNLSRRQDTNCMVIACTHGRLAMVKWLLRQGFTLDDESLGGRNALHLAARSGSEELVDYLLREGKGKRGKPFDVEMPDADGYTPLMVLAKYSTQTKKGVAMMRMLMARGADPFLPGPGGETPLDSLRMIEKGLAESVNMTVPEVKERYDRVKALVSDIEGKARRK